MNYVVLSFVLLAAVPALADDYSAGYDRGYYLGAYPSSDATNYGRGINDGMADADDDDYTTRHMNAAFEKQMQALSKREPGTYGMNVSAEKATDDGDQ